MDGPETMLLTCFTVWLIGAPFAVAAFCWHESTYAITRPEGFSEWVVTGMFGLVFGAFWPYCVPLCAIAYLTDVFAKRA